MSEEQLKSSLEALMRGAHSEDKLNSAAVRNADAVAAIAKEVELMNSADELSNAEMEISEEELQSVAGGVGIPPSPGMQYGGGIQLR